MDEITILKNYLELQNKIYYFAELLLKEDYYDIDRIDLSEVNIENLNSCILIETSCSCMRQVTGFDRISIPIKDLLLSEEEFKTKVKNAKEQARLLKLKQQEEYETFEQIRILEEQKALYLHLKAKFK